MSEHSEFGILSILGASSNFTSELADTASAACALQPGNLAMTSMIFAAFIWDADEPRSVKTSWAPELSRSTWPDCLPCEKAHAVLLIPVSRRVAVTVRNNEDKVSGTARSVE